jgi:DNA-binding response OmpR family regulator
MVEKSLTVLFGDADLERSKYLRTRLQEQGIGVDAAQSSHDLLKLAEKEDPDVVVLDDRLELIGSQVFISLLRRHCPTTRIILLMPEGTHPDRETFRHLDPVCCLVRPISDGDLRVVITAALNGVVPPGEGRPPVILCVDDDPLFLRSLVRILRRPGYAVISCSNPEEALEAIPILQPDLAFIDVLMPGMNGLDLASEIRDDYGDEFPLVLLSARTSDREISDGYRSGAATYITKPCEPESILRVAEELIPRARKGRKGSLRPTREPRRE